MSPKTVTVRVRDFNELIYSLRYRKPINLITDEGTIIGGAIVNSITVESGNGNTFIIKLLGCSHEYFVRT